MKCLYLNCLESAKNWFIFRFSEASCLDFKLFYNLEAGVTPYILYGTDVPLE